MLPSDKKDHAFNTLIYVLSVIFLILILIPLLFVLANSFSDYNLVFEGKVSLWPKNFSFEVYQVVLANPSIKRGFFNSILYTVIGTIISLALTLSSAYVLARKDFHSRHFFAILFLIPMFFSGGMIPTYLIVDRLNMINTIWGFIIPGCLSIWNVLVTRTFMVQSVPWELIEAAKLDGCDDFTLFFKIVLPLCIPIIAIMTLFYAVGYWNSYFNSLLYLTDPSLYPLQRILSDIIISSDISSMGTGGGLDSQGRMIEAIKYVTIVVSSAPILLLYPLLGKYFEKGMLVGSLKE